MKRVHIVLVIFRQCLSFCYSRCFLIAPLGKIILADTALKSWTPIGSDLGAAINLKTER